MVESISQKGSEDIDVSSFQSATSWRARSCSFVDVVYVVGLQTRCALANGVAGDPRRMIHMLSGFNFSATCAFESMYPRVSIMTPLAIRCWSLPMSQKRFTTFSNADV